MKSSLTYLILFGLILELVDVSAQASALVWKDDDAKVLHVIARMHYSTETLAGREFKPLARAATDEISRLWNEPKAEVLIKGVSYRVQFEIGMKTAPAGIANWILGYTFERSCMDNFVDIRSGALTGDNSGYHQGDRFGELLTTDDIGKSTTAAHEFGHGLGLQHNLEDETDEAVPGIMFARGTLVKPEFQYDRTVEAGQDGGTINPAYRHVRLEDVLAVHFETLTFNENGIACVGKGKIHKKLPHYGTSKRPSIIGPAA